MKKIAILTLRLNNNYGGILQAYALNLYLRSLGYDAYTLNVIEPLRKINFVRRFATFFWRIVKKVKGDSSVQFYDIQKQIYISQRPGIEQKRFIKKYIPTIDVSLPLTSNFHKTYNFDAYIVGSDQVWRPSFVSDLKTYFLAFAPQNIKKISYAASFGTPKFSPPNEETAIYQDLLKQFSGISIREIDAIDICRELCPNKDISHLIDPTLLLSKDHYQKLITQTKSNEKEKTLVVYILDSNPENKKIVTHLAKKLNLNPTFIGRLNKNQFPSIELWLESFQNADFILTDSFHGTVFSLIFNKPFLSIANTERGLSRFTSLLDLFNLRKRLIFNASDLNNLDSALLYDGINFDLVNNIIQQEQLHSREFLQTHLPPKNQ